MAKWRPELGVRMDMPVVGPIIASSNLVGCPSGSYLGCGLFESTPRHILIGVSISVPISRTMRVRLDPVYQRIGISDSRYAGVFEHGVGSPFGVLVFKNATRANRWRWPILLERQLSRHIRLGLGPEASTITGNRTLFEFRNPFTGEQGFVTDYLRRVGRHTVLGIGTALEFPFHFPKIVVAPEVRYTRWTEKHYGGHWALDEVTAGIAIRI